MKRACKTLDANTNESRLIGTSSPVEAGQAIRPSKINFVRLKYFKYLIVLFLPLSNSLFSQDLLSLLNDANEEAQQGKCMDAIQKYDQILTFDPSFGNAYAMKGLCYSMLGNPDSACICFIDGIEWQNQYSQNFYLKYCSHYHPKNNVEAIHAGRFQYLSAVDDSSTIIQRDASNQIEISGNGIYKTIFNIKWLSDADYSLKFVESNDPGLSFLKKAGLLHVKILKVSDSHVVYMLDFNKKLGFGMQKILSY